MPALTLVVHPGEYAICRLDPAGPSPEWAPATGFSWIARTPAEVAVVCRAEAVPPGTTSERAWRLLEIQGPFPFTATGILSAVLDPLARAGVGILATSTFDTDYVLVREPQLETAAAALAGAGHLIRQA